MENFKAKLKSIKVQDVTLVGLCFLAVYLFRSHDVYKLEPQWRKEQDSKVYQNQRFPSAGEKLPSPIITDLEGDGENEIVLITNKLTLQVLQMPLPFTPGILPYLQVKSAVKLDERNEDGKNVRPIAMETGYIDPYSPSGQVRKQVVIVVFEDWSVHCYDHELKLTWEQTLPVNAAGKLRPKSLGILISPHSPVIDNRGFIVIGGGLGHTTHGRSRKLKSRAGAQPSSIHPPHESAGEDGKPSHFSTFGLDGANGTIRWHHMPGDFEIHSSNIDFPAHHWKLELRKSTIHVGEEHWTKYSDNIFNQMPYLWRRLSDTRLEVARMKKNSNWKHPTRQNHPKPDASTKSPVEDLFGLAAEHIIGVAYGGMKPHSRHEHIKDPNAIVIHNHQGIEILSYGTGKPLSHIELEEKVVYADVNEDKVLDRVAVNYEEGNCRVEVTSIESFASVLFTGELCDSPSWFQSMSLAAMFTSQPKVNEDTHLTLAPVLVKSVALRSHPLQHLMGHALPSLRTGYDIILMTSNGRLTSYGPGGEFNWQTSVPVSWAQIAHRIQKGYASAHSPEVEIYNNAFLPSNTPFSRLIYGKQNLLVSVGWNHIAVTDLVRGQVLADHSLPCQAIADPVLGDFNNDGQTDFLIQCASGYYGIALYKQVNYIYTAVVGVAVVLGILLLSWCFQPDDLDIDQKR